MLKNLLTKGLLKDLGNVLQIFKDNKGRFSSKRTVAGVIAAAGLSWLSQLDPAQATTIQMIVPLVCFITAAAIVVLAPKMEKDTTDQYPEEK